MLTSIPPLLLQVHPYEVRNQPASPVHEKRRDDILGHFIRLVCIEAFLGQSVLSPVSGPEANVTGTDLEELRVGIDTSQRRQRCGQHGTGVYVLQKGLSKGGGGERQGEGHAP